MKLPSGTPLLKGERVKNAVEAVVAKIPRDLNGYIAVTGMGADGMEEGLFLVDSGRITHVSYLHLKYPTEIKGDEGLKLALNCFRTAGANVDVVEFTIQKLRLTASFNADAKLKDAIPLSDLPKYIPKEYDGSHVEGIKESYRMKVKEGLGLIE